MLDCIETLFNQFVVVCRLEETVSNTLFADQNAVLTLFKQADNLFTVADVFHAVWLMEFAKEETPPKNAIILTREEDTVLSELFVVQ